MRKSILLVIPYCLFLPKLTVHSWLSALQVERFEQKAHVIAARLSDAQSLEDVFLFITLARNFGFGLNGDAFEAWAKSSAFFVR